MRERLALEVLHEATPPLFGPDRLDALGNGGRLEVESPDPPGLAAHWARLIEVPVGKAASGEPELSFVNCSFRFIKGPKEVLGGLLFKVNDVATVREAARARGLKVDADSFHLGGVNFRLVA